MKSIPVTTLLNSIKNRPQNYSIGLNCANRLKTGVVYYTLDAPTNKLTKKQSIQYVLINTSHIQLSNTMGVQYPVHFVSRNG